MAPPPHIPPRPPQPEWPIPQRLKLHCEDLEHEGARLFFQNVDASSLIRDAILSVYKWLYTPETVPTMVEQVKLVLRPMSGVAHAFGSPTHKEIHLSLDHIVNCKQRAGHEIRGVVTHEMVHCFQYDARGSANGGLIEGMADYVRLNAKLDPPHWKRAAKNKKWDAGYETTGFFLQWMEEQYGEGTIRKLNGIMKEGDYDQEVVFGMATGGWKVDDLWEIYAATLEE